MSECTVCASVCMCGTMSKPKSSQSVKWPLRQTIWRQLRSVRAEQNRNSISICICISRHEIQSNHIVAWQSPRKLFNFMSHIHRHTHRNQARVSGCYRELTKSLNSGGRCEEEGWVMCLRKGRQSSSQAARIWFQGWLEMSKLQMRRQMRIKFAPWLKK